MTKPPQKREKREKRKKRREWTTVEDGILTYFKTQHPNLPWGKIIKEANLKDRDEKSCSHRWNNYLRFKFKKEKFSQEEDKLIIDLKSRDMSWALMTKERLLERRSPNAIKNRWNNHLKKRTPTVSDPRRPLPNHVQQPLMNDQTSDDCLSNADIKALISFLYNDDDLIPSSSIPVSDPRRPLPNHVQQPLMNDQTSDYSFSEDDLEALLSSFTEDQNPISLIPEHSS